MAEPQRDATYGDEAATRHITMAAAALKAAIIRNVADPEGRKAAIRHVEQAETTAFFAITV